MVQQEGPLMEEQQHFAIESAIKFLISPFEFWEEIHLLNRFESSEAMVQAASYRLKQEASRQPHIPLSVLWNYQHSDVDLDPDQLTHLSKCEDCTAVLALCRVQRSSAAVENKLKDMGFVS